MQTKFGSQTDSVDKNAFRRLPQQPLIDPAAAKASREQRPLPENVYSPEALIGQAAPIEGTPSIVELARALKNNVDLIYQFIHDNIDFYPNYGLHKGGWGALVDGCGNSFDQSDLMVQLLVQSGYTASYVLGNIELSAAQWSNWLNVSPTDISYAANLLGHGGFGGGYDPVGNTITIDYCWVQCLIGGTNYQFDPALKTYSYTTGINLASAMGYSQSSFLSDAQSGTTLNANWVENVNEPNISSHLSNYAMNLVNWIKTNNSGATFDQILGGRSIVPVVGTVRNATLPYASGSTIIISTLPNAYKATLQIQFGSINQTFYTNTIYGYRMSVVYNSSHQAQLYLNLPGSSGNIVATTAAQTIGTVYPMTFTITHPYATTFANEATILNLTAGVYYALGTSWGYAGRQMAEVHRQALVESTNAGGATDAENVLGESLSIIWWNFSGENASGTQIINQLSGCFNTFHHNIGAVGFYPITTFSLGNHIVVNFFFNNWITTALSPAANINSSSAHVSLLWHMLEAAVLTQTPGVPCASAPTVINAANGGTTTATITGTIHVGDVLNIFVHDSRLATNPTPVTYTAVSGDTTTTIATKMALAINNSATLAAIGVTATSATNILRIGSYSYINTTFTESVTTGSEIITLASTGGLVYGATKNNWLSTVEPALAAIPMNYSSTVLQSIGAALASYNDATIAGTVASGGGDVLNIFIHDPALAINPTQITCTTTAGDTTTTIATKLSASINALSTLSTIGITAVSFGNVLQIASLSANATTYTQSVPTGSEIIFLPNAALATISGMIASGGGDVLNIFVHDPALVINPTQVSYSTVVGDTLVTIASKIAAAINGASTLTAIGVIAGNVANILEIQSTSVNVTTYTASVTTGSESISLFYDNGDNITIPALAHTYVGNYFIGFGYYELNWSGSEFFGPLNNTGKGAASGDITDADCVDGSSVSSADIGGGGASGFSAYQAPEPIDLFKGGYLYSNGDISVGNQADPYQLSVIRSYNSNNSISNNGLGYGWSHNYQISASINSDGFIGFGYQAVSAAAAAIAEMYVCQDLLQATTPNLPVQNVVIICVANQWLTNQLGNNTAVVQFGGQTQVFAKLPNGTFIAPLGVKPSTNVVYAAGTFTYTTPDQILYSFNASGQVTTIAYPFGVTTNFTYTSGLLTTVSNGFRSLTFAYSGSNLHSITDGHGHSVFYTIASSNLTAFEDALTFSTTYSYVGLGQLSQVFLPANPSSATVTNAYDTLGRVKTQTDAYGNTWSYFFAGSRSEEDDPNNNNRVWYFDSFGGAIQNTDQLGNITLTEFDGLERPIQITYPEGNGTQYSYDQFSNILSITSIPKPGSGLTNITRSFTYDPLWNKVKDFTDGNGNVTTSTYDALSGLLTLVQFPAVTAGIPEASFTYNAIGQIQTATEPSGVVTAFAYDPTTKNRLTQVIDSGVGGLDLTSIFTYDLVGNIATIEDPNGNTTSLIFDATRRLTQVTEPAPFNFQTNYLYDHNNNLIEVQKQAVGSSVQQIYAATYTIDGLMSTVTEPTINANGYQPNSTLYNYDAVRRAQTITDSQGNIYAYTYDAMNRISLVTDPGGIVSDSRTFTNNGLLSTVTDGRSNETHYSYDGFDRIATTTYADSTTELNAYDNNNNITLFTNRSNSTISFAFDAMNQLVTKTPQAEAVVSYTYDLSGRVISVSVPNIPGDLSTGNFQQYYDTAGRCFKEEYSDGSTVTLTLDNNGNVTSITYPDTTIVSRTYDQLDRLTAISDLSGSISFGYDQLSRRTAQTCGNGVSTGYFYDLGNNLLTLAISSPASHQANYEYNSVHQQIGRQVNNGSYLWEPTTSASVTYGTANSVNQYSSVAGNSYSYNGNGCLTSDGIFTYVYDTENRLVSASSSSVSVSFRFDPLGRLALKTVGTTVTRFIYAGLHRIADYNSSGAIVNRYVSGESFTEPMWVEPTAGITTYFHCDETGSVIATTDSTGALTNQTNYSPFGECTSINGFNLGFTGQRYDSELGLYYFYARHYSPSLGRFLQPDPVGYNGGALNLYSYVNNDPMDLFDPYGLKWFDWGNAEFFGQWALGWGPDKQVHDSASDPVLQDFIRSPGARHLLEQYHQFGNPAYLNKLGYSTLQAAFETALPQFRLGGDSALPFGGIKYLGPDYSSVAFQVGGFGASKQYPKFGVHAVRVDRSGKPNRHGKFVQFDVLNVAGRNSFFYHVGDLLGKNIDAPLGSKGPTRTIIQEFKYIVPINLSPTALSPLTLNPSDTDSNPPGGSGGKDGGTGYA